MAELKWTKVEGGYQAEDAATSSVFEARRIGRKFRLHVEGEAYGDGPTTLSECKEVAATLAADRAERAKVANAKPVEVEVTISWGKEWTGSYYAETPGQGLYVQVMEASGRNSFRGCPLGSSFSSEEGAISDFIQRAGPEFTGEGTLTRDRIRVVRTVDHRKPVEPAPVADPLVVLAHEATQAELDVFDAVWREVEKTGGCDGFGGMEYRRVRREWVTAGCRAGVEEFIRRRANVVPVASWPAAASHYHEPRHTHPPTCRGCTTDEAKHGKPVVDESVSDDVLPEPAVHPMAAFPPPPEVTRDMNAMAGGGGSRGRKEYGGTLRAVYRRPAVVFDWIWEAIGGESM